MSNMNNVQGYNWNGVTAIAQPNQGIMQTPQNPQYPMNLQNIEPARKQIFYIPGRGVNSLDEIQAYEVVMDSPMNVFPKNDRKEIYVKYWGADGQIVTDTYKLVEKTTSGKDQNSATETMPAVWADMQKQLNRIEKMVRYGPKKYYNNGKASQKESE